MTSSVEKRTWSDVKAMRYHFSQSTDLKMRTRKTVADTRTIAPSTYDGPTEMVAYLTLMEV